MMLSMADDSSVDKTVDRVCFLLLSLRIESKVTRTLTIQSRVLICRWKESLQSAWINLDTHSTSENETLPAGLPFSCCPLTLLSYTGVTLCQDCQHQLLIASCKGSKVDNSTDVGSTSSRRQTSRPTRLDDSISSRLFDQSTTCSLLLSVVNPIYGKKKLSENKYDLSRWRNRVEEN